MAPYWYVFVGVECIVDEGKIYEMVEQFYEPKNIKSLAMALKNK